MPIRVTVWHEHRHERKNETVRAVYPDGIHMTLKRALDELLGKDATVRVATLDDDPEHGLSEKVLAETDVLTWWGHGAHHEVSDAVAARVAQRVREGMGFVVLHSGHYAKPFQRLMGTGCGLKWREAGERELIWTLAPGHPITAGVANPIDIPHEEMYGEHFDIPDPDELVFVSWFEGGEVFRSGCVWRRGAGKVFYFRPGHEVFPTYKHKDVQRVIANAIRYVAPTAGTVAYEPKAPNIKTPMNALKGEHKVEESLH